MCPGFGNAEHFDTLAAIQQWREKNIPPDKIIMSHAADGKAYRTRPVCPYPKYWYSQLR